MKTYRILFLATAVLGLMAMRAYATDPVLSMDIWGEWIGDNPDFTPQAGFTDFLNVPQAGALNPTTTTANGITVTLNGLLVGRNRGNVHGDDPALGIIPDNPPLFTDHKMLISFGAWDDANTAESGADRTVTITGLAPNKRYNTSVWAWDLVAGYGWDMLANGVQVVTGFTIYGHPEEIGGNARDRMDFTAISDGSGQVILTYTNPTSVPAAEIGPNGGQYVPYYINGLQMTEETALPPNVGDVNLDGIVNQLDLNVINGHWLASGQARATGDLNGDGLVNQLDLNLVNGNWLGTGGTGSFAAVPEPTTGVLLLLAGSAVLLWRGRSGLEARGRCTA